MVTSDWLLVNSHNMLFVVTLQSIPCQVTLVSTLSAAHVVCGGENVTFTCETRGSTILAWSSDDYIGRNGIQIQFLYIENSDKVRRPNAYTVAELTDVHWEGEVVVMTSVLSIRVQPDNSNSSVTCHSTGMADETNTTQFQLSGMLHCSYCRLHLSYCDSY